VDAAWQWQTAELPLVGQGWAIEVRRGGSALSDPGDLNAGDLKPEGSAMVLNDDMALHGDYEPGSAQKVHEQAGLLESLNGVRERPCKGSVS
jgi:hypothetical protein